MSKNYHGTNKNIKADLPPCPPGLDHISRYWDKHNKIFAAKLLPGEYYVSLEGELITTVLGSCISACIRDTKLGVGGMNHFMLPVGCEDEHSGKEHLTEATRYGNFAMEMLINEIIKAGGRKINMEVKLFGGGNVLSNMKSINVGNKNIDFVYDYLDKENLRVISEDVGDIYPRKIIYFPDTGRARVKKLYTANNNTIEQREEIYRKKIDSKPVESDIELF